MFKEETLFRAGQYNPSPARRKAINYVTFNNVRVKLSTPGLANGWCNFLNDDKI